MISNYWNQLMENFDLSSFEFIQTLGTGSFGRVRLALHKPTQTYLAIKSLKKSHLIRTKQVDHVHSEYSILKQISHPFIVNLKGFSQNSAYLFFALEFVPGGDLFTYLRTITSLTMSHSIIYASQIVLMFEYLHSLNIIYRDLKPENLLIASDGYLKLTDFGFAKVVDDRTYTLCGTPEYLAPEILLNKGHGKPVDWWTLGVIIYEMIAGIDPFNDEDPMVIYQKILKGKFSFTRKFDGDSKSLIRHLLVNDLSKRYGNLKKGVGDIKSHRWFKGVKWEMMAQKLVTMPYVPRISGNADCTHFISYPESGSSAPSVQSHLDPFLNWDV